MSGTYLPGDTRQRIQDLIKDSGITQAELAGIIGLSESALSRYLKGQTEMLGDGYIIKIFLKNIPPLTSRPTSDVKLRG